MDEKNPQVKIDLINTFIVINIVILALTALLSLLYVCVTIAVVRKIELKNKIMIMLLASLGLVLFTELLFYALIVYRLE